MSLPSALHLAKFARDVLPRVVVPVLAALLYLAANHNAARAAESTFVIADADGYGIMDCLTDGKSCGRVVADAWCEAHGLGAARSYGRASDVTGATQVSAAAPSPIRPDAVVVACGE